MFVYSFQLGTTRYHYLDATANISSSLKNSTPSKAWLDKFLAYHSKAIKGFPFENPSLASDAGRTRGTLEQFLIGSLGYLRSKGLDHVLRQPGHELVNCDEACVLIETYAKAEKWFP